MKIVNVESLVIGVVFVILTACNGNAITDAVPPQLPEESAYWSLTANYRAINLALSEPYNTVQLEVVPRNAYGIPISSEGHSPIYLVPDTTKLDVTENGILKAKAVGTNIIVLVSLQIGTITHVDTIFVKVAASPLSSPLATFSIQPVPPDSAVWSFGGDDEKPIRPVAKNTINGNITNLQVRYETSNRRVATVVSNGITNGKMTGKAAGRVWIIASTYAYGVSKRDSVEFIIGYPVYQVINVDRIVGVDGDDVAFYPSTVTIGVGGQVVWDFRKQWINIQGPGITFEEPDKAKGICPTVEQCQQLYQLLLWDMFDGNSSPRPIYGVDMDDGGFSSAVFTTRTWKEPGVYKFQDHWGRHSGTVIVLGRPTL